MGLVKLVKCLIILYEFIIGFLKDKNPNMVILSGHSHGNTYCFELLDRFIKDKKYSDKLVYLGCKGYLSLERVLGTALKGLENSDDKETAGIVKMVLPMLVGETVVEKLRNFIGPDVYYLIEMNNDNEKKIQKFVDKLEVTNYKLERGGPHGMTPDDFSEMWGVFSKYNRKDNSKVPCLLFYSEEDDYVGKEFSYEIRKISEEEEKAKKEADEAKKEMNDKRDAIIQKVYKKEFDENRVKNGFGDITYEQYRENARKAVNGGPIVAGKSLIKKPENPSEGPGEKKKDDTLPKKGCCKSCR